MESLELKYGCNPNQKPARIFMKSGELPIQVLNGNPGTINLLDALNGWQLVKEMKAATGLASAASFKHVSPAGTGVALPLDDLQRKVYFAEDIELTGISAAYIRARGADRVSSYGDFAALSDECDEATARFLSKEVSDGIIAPSYSREAMGILLQKRRGTYLIIQIDPAYEPEEMETKQVFGVTFEQARNNVKITEDLFTNRVTRNKNIPAEAIRDLLIAMITLKYTQSNSVCYAKNGQAIGVGAGQQSRILCTRLAGSKADKWHLRQHEKVLSLPFREDVKRPERDNAIDVYLSDSNELLDGGSWEPLFTEKPAAFMPDEKMQYLSSISGVSLASDAFFPFSDNISRAHRSGVAYIAQTGGSVRDDLVIEACDQYNMVMALTGIRLFHH